MKNWSEYSKEHYLFVLSQSEKKLTASIDTMNTIQARGRFQLATGIALITGLIGWNIKDSQGFNLVEMGVAVQSLVAVIIACFGIFKYRISTIGSSSEFLFTESLYSSFDEIEHAEKNLIRNECLDYAERINKNRSINGKRLRLVTWSFIVLILIPVTAFILFLVSQSQFCHPVGLLELLPVQVQV